MLQDLPGAGSGGLHCPACRVAAAGVCSPCGSGAAKPWPKKEKKLYTTSLYDAHTERQNKADQGATKARNEAYIVGTPQ